MTDQTGSRLTRRAGGGNTASGLVMLVVVGLLGWSIYVGLGNAGGSLAGAAFFGLPTEPDEKASNTACLDCHLDFAEELIAAKHLENGFACTACHGNSAAHGEDEANVTSPDVLFGRAQIGPFCKRCHPDHPSTPAYEDFINEWLGRRRPNGAVLLKDATCTDCHGQHTINVAG
jgi:hypothetical protein